ncbi:hypothetical protein BJ170DRAFT_607411 [Xylariales sp. AK1849]|nr:hypothetical protein BJ170DRAFT_607411 [Xylariales sp. AK1849]
MSTILGLVRWPSAEIATTFPKFSKLPVELKLMIWNEYFFGGRRIHVISTPPPDRLQSLFGSSFPTYQSIDAETREKFDYRSRLQPVFNYPEAFSEFSKLFEVVNFKAFGTLVNDINILSPDQAFNRLRTLVGPRQSLRNYRRFLSDQALMHWIRENSARSKKTFPINWDRDLVYLVNLRTPLLFQQLCQSPWGAKVQKLALVISDVERAESWESCQLKTALDIVGRQAGSTLNNFGLRLKEILLVVVPNERQSETMRSVGDLQRDEYGFVSYNDANLWVAMSDDISLTSKYERIEKVLIKMFRQGMCPIIRWVADIDGTNTPP